MDFGEIMNMLRNPQAIQAQAQELKRRTEAIEVEGSSGGGLVRVTLNGALEVRGLSIAPEVVDPAEIAMLQDLVKAAFNDASAKAREKVAAELSAGLGGMSLPPGLFGGAPGGNP
jgi:DNA-binding YbaB/EbfC family protein